MLDRQTPRPAGQDPPAGDAAARLGDRPEVDEARDEVPPSNVVTNQHSSAEDDFEVDAARNYHGVDDSA